MPVKLEAWKEQVKSKAFPVHRNTGVSGLPSLTSTLFPHCYVNTVIQTQQS